MKLINKIDNFYQDYLSSNNLKLDVEYEIDKVFDNYVTIKGMNVIVLKEFIKKEDVVPIEVPKKIIEVKPKFTYEELKNKNKDEQIIILKSLKVSETDIKKLKTESQRINKILEMI